MALMAEEMESFTPLISFVHEVPRRMPIAAATAAAHNSAIWFGPYDESSPKKTTSKESITTSTKIGTKARIRDFAFLSIPATLVR